MLLIHNREQFFIGGQFACKKEIGSKDRARIALLSNKGILPAFPTVIPMLGCFSPVLIFALLLRSTKTEMSRIQIWQHMINFDLFVAPAEFKRKILYMSFGIVVRKQISEIHPHHLKDLENMSTITSNGSAL